MRWIDGCLVQSAQPCTHSHTTRPAVHAHEPSELLSPAHPTTAYWPVSVSPMHTWLVMYTRNINRARARRAECVSVVSLHRNTQTRISSADCDADAQVMVPPFPTRRRSVMMDTRSSDCALIRHVQCVSVVSLSSASSPARPCSTDCDAIQERLVPPFPTHPGSYTRGE